MESVIVNFQDWLDNIGDGIVDNVSGSDVSLMWVVTQKCEKLKNGDYGYAKVKYSWCHVRLPHPPWG